MKELETCKEEVVALTSKLTQKECIHEVLMQGVFQTMLVMSRRNFKVIFLVMKCFILILLLFLSVLGYGV
jgi:hypothetical protein